MRAWDAKVGQLLSMIRHPQREHAGRMTPLLGNWSLPEPAKRISNDKRICVWEPPEVVAVTAATEKGDLPPRSVTQKPPQLTAFP
jgi:hypothetical protein